MVTAESASDSDHNLHHIIRRWQTVGTNWSIVTPSLGATKSAYLGPAATATLISKAYL